MYTYNCVIKRVVDGDTVDVDIDLGFGVWLHNERIRLSGIDAPEVRTRDLDEKARGIMSMAFVESKLPQGSTVKIITKEFHRGKYGRIIGDFEIYDSATDSWIMLTQKMLTEGYAEPY